MRCSMRRRPLERFFRPRLASSAVGRGWYAAHRCASLFLATAFETVYFWPGLEACFGQVARVLRPGGVFWIVNESDGTDETALKYEKLIDGMKCYTAEQLESALRAAGFSELRVEHHPEKPGLAVQTKK